MSIRKGLTLVILSVILCINSFPSINIKTIFADSNYLNNPTVDENGNTVWDCVWFGKYWQNDTNGDKKADSNDDKEYLKWRVLRVENNTAMLITDKIITYRSWHGYERDSTWNISSIRKWLNSYADNDSTPSNSMFYYDAFSEAEKKLIQTKRSDPVVLLEIGDVSNTLLGFRDNNSRKAVHTPYAAYLKSTTNRWQSLINKWWLNSRVGAFDCRYIQETGAIYSGTGYGVDHIFGIRPVIYIDISKGDWVYAGVVNSNGTENEISFEDNTYIRYEINDSPQILDDKYRFSDCSLYNKNGVLYFVTYVENITDQKIPNSPIDIIFDLFDDYGNKVYSLQGVLEPLNNSQKILMNASVYNIPSGIHKVSSVRYRYKDAKTSSSFEDVNSIHKEFLSFYSDYKGGKITVPIDWGFDLFFSNPNELNVNLALSALVLSNGAYTNKEGRYELFAENCEKLGLTDLYSFNDKDDSIMSPRTYFAYKKIESKSKYYNLYMVAVRGTQGENDIKTDIIDGSGSLFSSSARIIKEFLLAYMSVQKHGGNNDYDNIFFITGHSLGAATANSLAVQLGVDGYNNIFTYTYESPHTATAYLTEIEESGVVPHNFINVLDWVPNMPPWAGATTFGKNYFFNSDLLNNSIYRREINENGDIEEDSKEKFYGIGKYKENKIDPFAYHSLDWNYIALLQYIEKGDVFYHNWMNDESNEILNMIYDSSKKIQSKYVSVVGKTVEIYKTIFRLDCPIDVEIIVGDELIAESIDDVVYNYNIDKAQMIVIDDKKYVIVNSIEEYDIKIKGTDDGTMNYSVLFYDYKDEEMKSVKQYENVEISKDKVFKSTVSINNIYENIEASEKDIELLVLDNEGNEIKKVDTQGVETNLYSTISSYVGKGGTITPSGNKVISYGNDQVYSIVPNNGYRIGDVTVDDESQGNISSYTFTNVTEDHTISASFEKNKYTITSSSGSGGSISPKGEKEVEFGDNQEYSFIPDEGYSIKDVIVDGESYGAVSSFTFSNVNENHTISVLFEVIDPNCSIYTITAIAGQGGRISPYGSVIIEENKSQSFNIMPYKGYKIQDVKVDKASIGAVSKYIFDEVKANHSIVASFTKNSQRSTSNQDDENQEENIEDVNENQNESNEVDEKKIPNNSLDDNKQKSTDEVSKNTISHNKNDSKDNNAQNDSSSNDEKTDQKDDGHTTRDEAEDSQYYNDDQSGISNQDGDGSSKTDDNQDTKEEKTDENSNYDNDTDTDSDNTVDDDNEKDKDKDTDQSAPASGVSDRKTAFDLIKDQIRVLPNGVVSYNGVHYYLASTEVKYSDLIEGASVVTTTSDIVKINQLKGTIRFKKSGSATIVADNGKKQKVVVFGKKPLKITIPKASEFELPLDIMIGTAGDLIVNKSDKASLTTNGVLTAKKEGTVKLKYSHLGKKRTLMKIKIKK